MNHKPPVSVIMATYNRSNILPYSIGSVLDQSFQDFELLVVGDGCTDDSQSVVESLGDPRIRWIGLARNSGHQSVPNNVGIAESRGDLIAYLGHDDLWLPHHLEVCCEAITKGFDMAYGLSLIASESPGGDLLGPPRSDPATWIPPSSVVHKKSIFDSIGDWKLYTELPDMSPDQDLWRRIQLAGFRLSFLPRLSVIKIPAAMRKDVYRKLSTAEQERWQQRMRAEPFFEVTALADCYFNLRAQKVDWNSKSYGMIVRWFIEQTMRRTKYFIHNRIWKRGFRIEKNRKFKGLPRQPERIEDTDVQNR